jgi:hypothetical protein
MKPQAPSRARTAVTARIAPEHLQKLRDLADRNASTVSRTVGRIIDRALTAREQRDEHDGH